MKRFCRDLLSGLAAATTLFVGSVALAGSAGGVSADELSSLKAELESLQSRVSQLEAQPQASVPAGYGLLAIRNGQPYFDYLPAEKSDDVIPEDAGFTLSVAPAADVAPESEVAISAELRNALLYTDFEQDDNADIATRVRFIVRGKTETPVGEVGGYFRLKAEGGGDFTDFDPVAQMQRAFGWWKFAPDWQLLAGQEDMTATLLTSWDWNATTGPVRSFGPSDAYNEQMRVSYAAGGWTFGASLEDPDYDTNDPPRNDIPAVHASAVYSKDDFTGQVAGLWQSDDHGSDEWAIGGGVQVSLAKDFILFGAAVVGEGTAAYANNLAPLTPHDDFWAGSAGIIASLTEETSLELGVGIEDYQEAGEALGGGGGIYWSPVKPVRVGVQVTYIDFNDAFVGDESTDDNSLQIAVGLWLRGLRYE